MIKAFHSYLERARYKYGDRFDGSDLSRQFVPYYESQRRIEVLIGEEKVRGYVGVTTGWRPTFILLYNSRSISSPHILSDKDTILREFPSRRK